MMRILKKHKVFLIVLLILLLAFGVYQSVFLDTRRTERRFALHAGIYLGNREYQR